MTASHVQYGCGFLAPGEWLNFDASPTLRLEKIPMLGPLMSPGNGRFPVNVAGTATSSRVAAAAEEELLARSTARTCWNT